MKLTVFGATGTLGRVLTAMALADGHEVTAVSRGGFGGGLRGGAKGVLRDVRGDVLDPVVAHRAVAGADAVLCTLGAGRKGNVRAPGTANILAGMKAHGVRRFVCQTTLGAGDSAGNLNFFWKYVMFGLLLRPAMADHEAQEALIRTSDTDWTIVRPAAFTDGPETGDAIHGFSGTSPVGLTLKVSRADIARFMLGQLTDTQYLRQTPGLSYSEAAVVPNAWAQPLGPRPPKASLTSHQA